MQPHRGEHRWSYADSHHSSWIRASPHISTFFTSLNVLLDSIPFAIPFFSYKSTITAG